MLKLGVNIDHIATLRQARYAAHAASPRAEPDPIAAALEAEAGGAHGITAHLREDRRHIQDADMLRLRGAIATRLNFEMANTPEILAIALAIHPDDVCLVPERRQEITTEGGLNAVHGTEALRPTVAALNSVGIAVSLFVDPDAPQIRAAAALNAAAVELHTGAYADTVERFDAERELARLAEAARLAHSLGLRVNAGHGLNYTNVPPLLAVVPHLQDLNIGHSIISRAVSIGLRQAVSDMLSLMRAHTVRGEDPR